jgi:hypothetical protein
MSLLVTGSESFWVSLCRRVTDLFSDLSPIGALFLYRRNHRSVLMQIDADDLNAVRINIPLSRVESAEKTQLPAFAGLISFTFDPTRSNGAPNGVPVEQTASTTEELSILDTPPVKQVLQLGVLREDTLWENLMAYANKAKAAASKSNVDWPGSSVFIDLDPRTSNSPETSDNNLSDLVKSVSFALGLDTTKEMWSMSHLMFLSRYLTPFQSKKLMSTASSGATLAALW